MPLDTSIALQAKLPQIDGPLDNYAKGQQLQSLMNQGRMQDLQMKGLMRQQQEEDDIKSAYANAADPESRLQALMKVSPKAYQGEAKFQQEQQKAKIEAAKTRLDLTVKMAPRVISNPTMANAMSVIDEIEKATGFNFDSQRQELARMGENPSAIKQWAYGHALEAKDLLPKFQHFDSGGKIVMGTSDPLTGTFSQTGDVTKTNSPDAILSSKTSMRNADVSAATSRENSIRADKRMKETNEVTREGNNAKRITDNEMKLADDYAKQSKNYQDVNEAVKRVNSSLNSANTSAAATLAAATSFMKLLDPGSVVRESELGMALAATGAIDRAMNYVNTLQNGRTLTKSQVEDFKNITAKVHEGAKQAQRQIDDSYKIRAKNYGLNENNIITDLGQNEKPEAPKYGKPSLDDIFK